MHVHFFVGAVEGQASGHAEEETLPAQTRSMSKEIHVLCPSVVHVNENLLKACTYMYMYMYMYIQAHMYSMSL